jgi:hypothetical protein
MCPTGWIFSSGSCMRRFDKLNDWASAQADCLSKNSTLLVINSQAEYNLVNNLLRTSNQTLWVLSKFIYTDLFLIF